MHVIITYFWNEWKSYVDLLRSGHFQPRINETHWLSFIKSGRLELSLARSRD